VFFIWALVSADFIRLGVHVRFSYFICFSDFCHTFCAAFMLLIDKLID